MLYTSPQVKHRLGLVPLGELLQAHERTEVLWDRALELAVTLSLNVIRLCGSWMRETWNSFDILLTKLEQQEVNTQQACLEWDVTSSHVGAVANVPATSGSLASHLIRSEATFSLGLVLVELAFDRPLTELFQPEDTDPDIKLQNVKTVTRLLPRIRGNKGKNYFKALEACLFVPPSVSSTSFDDKEFQDYCLRNILSPLMADFQLMFAPVAS